MGQPFGKEYFIRFFPWSLIISRLVGKTGGKKCSLSRSEPESLSWSAVLWRQMMNSSEFSKERGSALIHNSRFDPMKHRLFFAGS